MYVLIHKGRVLNGPRSWNRAMFDGVLENLKIQKLLPRNAPSEEELPIVIDADTRICRAELVYPQYNQKTEYLYGPLWDLSGDIAIANHDVKDSPIETSKANLKNDVALVRYEKEILGTKTTVQNTEVTIDTRRESRDIFVQKYILMSDTETVNWKFPEGWLSLTKSELLSIIAAGADYVQQQFNWELAKGQEIDAATTKAELEAIVIREEDQQQA